MSCSEWCERYRQMSADVTAEPGPWRNSRTPYLAGIMDAVGEPGVEEVALLKAVQVGFSEATRNLLGYWIDHDPGPAMIVMPTQVSSQEVIEERVRPMVRDTPRLRKHLGGAREDNKQSAIRFDTMTVYTGWAGSPQALATRPIRRVIFDEVDKYPPFAGREADPISLGMKRLTTYGHRARAIIGSTPTTRLGPIWQRWEGCTDRRHFHVTCLKCDHEQRLRWQQVRWPARGDDESRKDHAERIESESLARYECESCKTQWTDAEKNAAVRKGLWVSEVSGAPNRRVGFHLSSIYSPWLSMSKLAGEFINAQDDPAKLMDFANSRLAEPFEEQTGTTKADTIRDKTKHAGDAMRVPDWAQLLIATADVQKDHLWYVIRAWGSGFRSQLVRYGVASGFDELWQLWTVGYPDSRGEVRPVMAGGVDARYRTDEVMSFCTKAPAQLWPVMGSDTLRASPIKEHSVKGYSGVVQRSINANYWRDVLHNYIHADDVTQWLPHKTVGDDYSRHMSAEHRVRDPKTGSMIWQSSSKGAANHLFDCEVLQCMMAWALGVGTLTSDLSAAKSPPNDNVNIEPQAWLNRGRSKW